ncbi:MAG TPA: histidine kinase dimerization/phosphoacceptor domain -containing protein [Bacteroidota bacterium]|nr:histidine kinase dimerization/phosphoacceptor domain -containing protein [Bacteroidota bacterium]
MAEHTSSHEIESPELRHIAALLPETEQQWRLILERYAQTIDQWACEVEQTRASLQYAHQHIQLLTDFYRTVLTAEDVGSIVRTIEELIPRHCGPDQAKIFLRDVHTNMLLHQGTNAEVSFTDDVSGSAANSVTERCFQTSVPVIIHDCRMSDIVNFASNDATQIKSVAAFPLTTGSVVMGILQIEYSNLFHTFVQDEIDFYNFLSNHIAQSILSMRCRQPFSGLYDSVKDSEEIYYRLFEDVPIGLFRSTPEGKMLRVNPAMVQLLGYPDRDVLLHTNAYEFYVRPADRKKWQALVEVYDVVREMELELKRYDGTSVWAEYNARVTRSPKGAVIYYDGALANISERKKSETQIREAFSEKEVLLKEIHHRVKNNLQIISSLLNLQSDYLHDAYDRELFRQSQNRVRAMALLHEKLYQSSNLARIDFGEYVQSLVASLFQTYKTSPAAIEYEIDIAKLEFDIDTAIPCGLIVGELVSNSLKHAFPNNRSGKVFVSMVHIDPKTIRLSVVDDGIGFDAHPETASHSLGWELVRTLAGQLGGSLHILNTTGTHVQLIFKERSSK